MSSTQFIKEAGLIYAYLSEMVKHLPEIVHLAWRRFDRMMKARYVQIDMVCPVIERNMVRSKSGNAQCGSEPNVYCSQLMS